MKRVAISILKNLFLCSVFSEAVFGCKTREKNGQVLMCTLRLPYPVCWKTIYKPFQKKTTVKSLKKSKWNKESQMRRTKNTISACFSANNMKKKDSP